MHRLAPLMFLAALISVPFAASADDLNQWLKDQNDIAIERLMENISPEDALPGTVIASPSRQKPDYYFHWVRDAALVMNTVIDLYESSDDSLDQQQYLSHLYDFAQLVRLHQSQPTLSGLGEPKFNVDGSGYEGPWGRPQNDGPALRATTLIRFARILLQNGDSEYVQKYLYNSDFKSTIKRDLEYVAHHWTADNFDLWEEVKGHHFYTRMVQRRSLVEGAQFARHMGDTGAADFYEAQAEAVTVAIYDHLSDSLGYIENTLGQTGGLDYKHSNLDTAVLLAALHAEGDDDFFSASNDWVLNTAHHLRVRFAEIYQVNKNYPNLGASIGRYPEDQYYGGNPWFLTTHAFAEVYYKAYRQLDEMGTIDITPRSRAFYQSLLSSSQKLSSNSQTITRLHPLYFDLLEGLKTQGDAFMQRSRFHAGKDGNMDEQINRYTGYMESARDLTWSYASFITAVAARSE